MSFAILFSFTKIQSFLRFTIAQIRTELRQFFTFYVTDRRTHTRTNSHSICFTDSQHSPHTDEKQ